jgi:hypothetical protein
MNQTDAPIQLGRGEVLPSLRRAVWTDTIILRQKAVQDGSESRRPAALRPGLLRPSVPPLTPPPIVAAEKDFAFVVFRTPEAVAKAVAAGCKAAGLEGADKQVTVEARVLYRKVRERG